ncbi:MAG: divalent-cation tolerance protein CutA [Arcobacteraceae bacterium]|nr:divalent-cation tolerance protein CutA [Arcobacteraceae bacterium]
MKLIIIQTSFDSKKEAKIFAKFLLKEKLAGCIQISTIKSFYHWNNQICEDKEYLLSIKTKKENYKKIQRKIKENHSYDLPEIIAIKITKNSREYKKFIKENTI